MATYKIGLISGEKEISFVEKEKKSPSVGQVLVKVETCAICTLEQRIYGGSMPRYPFAGGHEMAGTVEAIGEGVLGVAVGDKVAMRMLTSCGECYYCRSGNENQCVISFKSAIHEGINGPGGFSEYMMVEAKSVYKLNPNINMSHAALVEPLACCVHSVGNAKIEFGNDVVVIGVGIMGAFHIKLAKMRGARVIACEASEERLAIAKKLGADEVINTKNSTGVDEVKALTDGRGADVVFCTVAIPALAANSIAMIGKLGRVVFYSSFHPNLPIEMNPNELHYSEAIYTGSVNPGTKDFLASSRLLSAGLIDVSELISGEVPLADLKEGIELALRPDTYRVIVKM